MRDGAVEEVIRWVAGSWRCEAHIWHAEHLIVDFVMVARDESGKVTARLDCAHNEIHVHMYDRRPPLRHVLTHLTGDPNHDKHAVSQAYEGCWDVFNALAEGKRPWAKR